MSTRGGEGETGTSPVTSFSVGAAAPCGGGSGAGGGGSGRRHSAPEPGGAAKANSIAEPLRRRVSPDRSGDSGPGTLPRAGQTPVTPGPAPRGDREAVGLPWASASAAGWGAKQPPRLSLLAPLLLRVEGVTSASPRTNFSPSGVC